MVSLVEEMIFNPAILADHMVGWRRYRIEYVFEGRGPEGWVYLPPHVDPASVENYLNDIIGG